MTSCISMIIRDVEGVKQMQQTKTYRKYKENSKERFVRYSEGAEMYHVSVSKFMQMAKDASKGALGGRFATDTIWQ